MKKFWYIILLIILSLLVLFLITNPDILKNTWLWLVGFSGGIAGLIRNIYKQLSFKTTTGNSDNSQPSNDTNVNQIPKETLDKADVVIKEYENKETNPGPTPVFEGTTITVLRYSDDGETTLGLLFIDKQFYCYTLEDAQQEVKVPGKTRIPSGTYDVNFLIADTALTIKYQQRFDWFNYHLEIKNVPNFSNIYIHIGNSHKDTDGCLLIANGINASSMKRSIIESTNAYKRFYTRIKDLLNGGEKVRIIIHDENWFKESNL